jgi:hypothetical protein
VCVDSIPPTSKIKEVKDLLGDPPGFAPNIPFPSDHSAFLRADNKGDIPKTYRILVEDADNAGGSGLDLSACWFSINNKEAEKRPCNGELQFKVGKTGADCTSEGIDACKIKVWSKDKAENKNDAATLEREIGRNPITSSFRFSNDEREYNDFVTHPEGFNVWSLGVDWTPPTAQ